MEFHSFIFSYRVVGWYAQNCLQKHCRNILGGVVRIQTLEISQNWNSLKHYLVRAAAPCWRFQFWVLTQFPQGHEKWNILMKLACLLEPTLLWEWKAMCLSVQMCPKDVQMFDFRRDALIGKPAGSSWRSRPGKCFEKKDKVCFLIILWCTSVCLCFVFSACE